MKKLRINHNQKGFTLIELMIVIAIIGILAAIAIPNFISYRNKAFCARVESDANSIAAGIASYFASASNVSITKANYEATSGAFVPPDNTYSLTAAAINTAITITVTDASNRCPAEYISANSIGSSTSNFTGWVGGSNPGQYQKIMQ